MFYYYGRKKRLIHLYPHPLYSTIIESFAGAAAYGCRWHQGRKVVLIEKDDKVVALWHELQKMTYEDVMNLPDIEIGQSTNLFLHILHAASKRAFEYKNCTVTKVMKTNWDCNKHQMASMVRHIKDWTIIWGDYTDAPNIEATWFIDPPYPGEAGTGYRHSSKSIDYHFLSQWVRERKGQVIACSHAKDTWLPFNLLYEQSGISGKRNMEGIYTQGCMQNETLF